MQISEFVEPSNSAKLDFWIFLEGIQYQFCQSHRYETENKWIRP